MWYSKWGIEMSDERTTDVLAYDEAHEKCREIFLERRRKYGCHLTKAARFPHEDTAGLYLKCARTIRDIDAGKPVDTDTLRDLHNYSCMLLSL